MKPSSYISVRRVLPGAGIPGANFGSVLVSAMLLGACSSDEPAAVLPAVDVSSAPAPDADRPRLGTSATDSSTSAASSISSAVLTQGGTASGSATSATPSTTRSSASSTSLSSASSSSTQASTTGSTSHEPSTTRADTTSTSDPGSADSSTGDDNSSETGSQDDSGTQERTCLPLCAQGTKDAFVDCVVEFKPNPITAHYTEEYETTDPNTGETITKTREYYGWNHDKMPEVVLGPPKGVFDTVSLGCEGSLAVGFVDPPITDGPGPDLIVFENPFAETFPEPLRVEVSDDACTWHTFPCDPVTLQGCGGVSVVKALPSTDLDPTDPAVAGGDAFDLADVGLPRARFVRVYSVSREYWLAKENTEKWCDPGPMTTGKGGSDIDAFAFVHAPATPPQE